MLGAVRAMLRPSEYATPCTSFMPGPGPPQGKQEPAAARRATVHMECHNMLSPKSSLPSVSGQEQRLHLIPPKISVTPPPPLEGALPSGRNRLPAHNPPTYHPPGVVAF